MNEEPKLEEAQEKEDNFEVDYEKARRGIVNFFTKSTSWIYYVLLAIIVWIGVYIRTRNLSLLKDITTNDYIPMDLDANLFLRYTRELFANGYISAVDHLRSVPLFKETIGIEKIIPYTIVFLHKIVQFFYPLATINLTDNLYPVLVFIPAIIIFFFLVKKLFNNKVAILATAFLTLSTAFVSRTMVGFSEKEPLAILFMFLALYLYISAIKSEKNYFLILLGALAGFSTGLMGLTWGGAQFVFIIIAAFTGIEILLNKSKLKDNYAYISWVIVAILVLLIFPSRYEHSFSSLFSFPAVAFSLLILFVVIIDIILFKKKLIKFKWEDKLPHGVITFIIALIVLAIGATVILSPDFIIHKLKDIIATLIHPVGVNRWLVTVAENHQPYFTNWIDNFASKLYVWAILIGSIYLFYRLIKPIKKLKITLTIIYSLFLAGFVFSRYSPNSILNGTSGLSQFLYFGSLIMFIAIIIILYLYYFFKNKEVYDRIVSLKKEYVFIFVWFFLMIVAARGAVRLFFVFAPVTAIVVSFLLISIMFVKPERLSKYWLIILEFIVAWIGSAVLLRFISALVFKTTSPTVTTLLGLFLAVVIVIYTSQIKNNEEKVKISKAIFIIGILLLLLIPVTAFSLPALYKVSYNQVRYSGPIYNQQWQVAGQWIRTNTPKDAVFGHWWDYGYMVQTGGERATVLDGANSIVYWDYLMGRHVLSGQNETEALEFLYAHNTTHFLIDPSDVGKYPAYSSIGSDENNDRYSWITSFSLNPKLTQETRNETLYVYQGQYVLDDDFIYQDIVYPRGGAGLGGFIIPISPSGNNSIEFKRPTAALFYNGRQVDVPVNCIYFNGQKRIFGNDGLPGCLRFLPSIENNQMNPLGALYFVSDEGTRALWARMYLFDEQFPHFKLVYTDEDKMPLALYNGRQIGPIKIWEVSYPKDIKFREDYIFGELPDWCNSA